MALTVFKVDDLTRLVLPDSQWGLKVRETLSRQGHNVIATSEIPDLVQRSRSDEELARVHDLLGQVGRAG